MIDPDYRGEIGVILLNLGGADYMILRGDRIAQLLIIPTSNSVLTWRAERLPSTERGADGFGSTGV